MIPPADDPLLHYLASHIMQHGERHKASRVVTNMLAQIHRLTEAPPLPILRHAIFLASPSVRIKSHKKSAKSVMVPMPLSDRQRTFFAVQWLLNASKSRNERKLEDRLAKEVIRIIEGESDVLKKKTEVHKLAVANRYVAFGCKGLHKKLKRCLQIQRCCKTRSIAFNHESGSDYFPIPDPYRNIYTCILRWSLPLSLSFTLHNGKALFIYDCFLGSSIN